MNCGASGCVAPLMVEKFFHFSSSMCARTVCQFCQAVLRSSKYKLPEVQYQRRKLFHSADVRLPAAVCITLLEAGVIISHLYLMTCRLWPSRQTYRRQTSCER